jgi:hypothetical protein
MHFDGKPILSTAPAPEGVSMLATPKMLTYLGVSNPAIFSILTF